MCLKIAEREFYTTYKDFNVLEMSRNTSAHKLCNLGASVIYLQGQRIPRKYTITDPQPPCTPHMVLSCVKFANAPASISANSGRSLIVLNKSGKAAR